MLKFLVTGLKEMEAGKTTVVRALLLHLREHGIAACGFKPKAANTLWYDYDIVHESLSQGRLYGKDAKLLRKASMSNLPEELISPVHRLWATPPHHLKQKLATLPFFIVDRITLQNKQPREIVVVNDTLPFRHVAEKLVANLCTPEKTVLHVNTVKELNEIVDHYYDKAICYAHQIVKAENEALVYESYADVALPWKGIRNLDLVFAVHPGYIQTYNPEKYFSALKLSTSLNREAKTEKVVRLLNPIITARIPPYKSGEIIEGTKRKIDSILKGIG